MKIDLANLHLAVGILGMLVFVLTGQYIALVHNGLLEMADGPRLLIRTAHLYIMLSSAINVVVGIYARELKASMVQLLISLVLLSAPVFMILEFFFGTTDVNTQRPFAYYSLVAIFAVISLMVLQNWLKNRSK